MYCTNRCASANEKLLISSNGCATRQAPQHQRNWLGPRNRKLKTGWAPKKKKQTPRNKKSKTGWAPRNKNRSPGSKTPKTGWAPGTKNQKLAGPQEKKNRSPGSKTPNTGWAPGTKIKNWLGPNNKKHQKHKKAFQGFCSVRKKTLWDNWSRIVPLLPHSD